MRLKLKEKLFGSYLVVITLLVGIAGGGALTLLHLMGDYRGLVETAIPAQKDLFALEEIFRLQTGNERKFYVVGSPAIGELFKSQTTEWNGLVGELSGLLRTDAERTRLEALARAHGTYAAQVYPDADPETQAQIDQLFRIIAPTSEAMDPYASPDEQAMDSPLCLLACA